MTRFDRRALFASGAAAALLAATGMSLAATPKRGGHLRIAVPRADGLAPAASAAVFETLTELTPDGVLRGRLATGWHSTQNAAVWVLTLRTDASFHDGAPVRAEDVAVSLEHAPIGLPALVDIALTGPDGVRLTLADSDPHLPIRLAGSDCIICPATNQGGLIGSGLYAVRHVTAGGGLAAVRVDDHYLAEEAGWADKVDIVAMSDPGIRAEALGDGMVEAAVFPEETRLAQYSGLRRLPLSGAPELVLSDRVGCAPATAGMDSRMAERLWLE
ncbi:MAG: ABC transporter substrate-binding protein [Paracoccaceae bacterium]